MQDDERCCGSGTCIIDANGLCWCGQRWQGDQLCSDEPLPAALANSLPTDLPELIPVSNPS